jgi:hypothetical protein
LVQDIFQALARFHGNGVIREFDSCSDKLLLNHLTRIMLLQTAI